MEELKLNCLIVDDEEMALNLLESYVQNSFSGIKGQMS